MRVFTRWVPAAATWVAMAACSGVVWPEAMLVRAQIVGSMEEDPDWSVTVTGRTLEIAITTYGDGCYSVGETRTEVDPAATTVRVEPYDVVRRGRGLDCDSLLQHFSHAATVEVSGSGSWEVVLIGLDAEGETLRVERVVEIE